VRYTISHLITYAYAQPVTLAPHWVRLRPRCDVTQSLKSFSLDVTCKAQQETDNIDLDGNSVLRLWFADNPIMTLTFKATSEVETHRSNPFAYLLEPWAVQLPFDYPAALHRQLEPYLSGVACNFPNGPDPSAVQLAQQIWHETDGNTVLFLSRLNQHIYQNCQYTIRETGDPMPPGITWGERFGSCRDLTVLFMEVCRAMGLATRFVSGYQEGDPDWSDSPSETLSDSLSETLRERHLHAWAEVYLPGAGWRGYDPTQGLAVADRHIALVASPSSRSTAPIMGALKTGIGTQSKMSYRLMIQPFKPSAH
jgi:transglutaminase-like putative cysteine protease